MELVIAFRWHLGLRCYLNNKSVKFGQPPNFPKSTKKVNFDEEIEDKTTDESNITSHVEPEESKTKKSAQDRAGVKFPINKLSKFAKSGKYAERIGQGAPVFMAGVKVNQADLQNIQN